ncbi:Fur family transcriptional regulator [Undibacterium sp. Di24W]|uniref:Fur family transcriptional regulator n=1 Tax=Undibacterium sp. Di24W TaxID=3413033 RepID=UPI003BEF8E32
MKNQSDNLPSIQSMQHKQHEQHEQIKSEAQQNRSSFAIAEHKLRAAQVRVTQARLDVLSVLLKQHRAMSHTEMQDALPAMDRVTLYRALDCLADAGLAHKITGDDRVFRFSTGSELNVSAETSQHINPIQHQHGHFKCTRCSKVFCLEQPAASHTLSDQLQATLDSTALKGFQSHDIEVTIKGWCDRCNDA